MQLACQSAIHPQTQEFPAEVDSEPGITGNKLPPAGQIAACAFNR